MIHAQNIKYANLLAPVILDNTASSTSTEVDTAGYDYATVIVHGGETTDTALAEFAITESDDSGSGHAAFWTMGTQLQVAGTATSGVDAADEIQAIEIDLRNRKRYLNVTSKGGNGTVGTSYGIMCILTRAGESNADSASDRGLDQLSRI